MPLWDHVPLYGYEIFMIMWFTKSITLNLWEVEEVNYLATCSQNRTSKLNGDEFFVMILIPPKTGVWNIKDLVLWLIVV